MAMLGQILRVPRNFAIFHDSLFNKSEGRRYRSNYLRISAIGLKFSEMMHTNMKQTAM